MKSKINGIRFLYSFSFHFSRNKYLFVAVKNVISYPLTFIILYFIRLGAYEISFL